MQRPSRISNRVAKKGPLSVSDAANGNNWRIDLAVIEQLAHWLDSKFVIPGLGIRFGVDAILGLIPGLGDLLTSVASLYILVAAARHNAPRVTQARMAGNIAVDWLMGSFPLLGDLFDVAWKSNQRNAVLLKRHLLATSEEQRLLRKHDWLFLILLVIGLLMVLAIAVSIAFFLIRALWQLIAQS